MSYSSLANNQTISFNNLQDGVNTGVLSQKAAIPVSNEQITKAEANTYVNIDTSFAPYAAKASNQLVVKSNLKSTVSVFAISGTNFYGIDNNQTTVNPIQLICGGLGGTLGNFIYRSTDYGLNYIQVLSISNSLEKVKFMPNFRHASYLTVPPFVAVGNNGRIVTNSVTNCSSWVTINSPTTTTLYDIAFNSLVGIIVGEDRILKTNTNNRINSWSIVNSAAGTWASVASDGSRFVAVNRSSTNANKIILGDSLGTTWSFGNMPPLSTPNISLSGVTFHTDSFFYAVGVITTTIPFTPIIIRSSDSGFNWSFYDPIGDTISGIIFTINSIGGRLVIGGINAQYQIINNVVTRYDTPLPSGNNAEWHSIVKDANSNGFDMAGSSPLDVLGLYSNF
jgi:hypothetical protein